MANRAPAHCGACGSLGHIVTSCPDAVRRGLYRARQLEDWMRRNSDAHLIGSWALREMIEVREGLESALERLPRAPLDRVGT
jgi:hypothetical protein